MSIFTLRKYAKKFFIFRAFNRLIVRLKYELICLKYRRKSNFLDLQFPKSGNVLYVGTDEMQDKSGFIQELSKVYNVYLFTKDDGSYGQYHEYIHGNLLGPNSNTNRLERILEELSHQNIKIDFVLMQSWGRLWDVERLINLKLNYAFKMYNICMDDRHSFRLFSPSRKYNRGSSGLIPALDGALVAAKECVNWYNHHGVAASYFPEASSTEIFYPLNLDRKYDVGFVGSRYGKRGDYIQYLMDSGISVQCYGEGWPAGRLQIEKVNEFYNSCKIVVGFSYILDSNNFAALKLRDFDVPMSGTLYLTSYNADLLDLFPEKTKAHYFNSKYELLRLVKYFLMNESDRVNLARQCFINSIENHTYEKRLLEIINE